MMGRLWQGPAKVFVTNRTEQNYSNAPIGADGLGSIDQPLDLSFKLAEALLARERVRHPISQNHHRWLDSLQVLAQLLESLAGLIKVKGGPRCARRRVSAPSEIAKNDIVLREFDRQSLFDVTINLLALNQSVTNEH